MANHDVRAVGVSALLLLAVSAIFVACPPGVESAPAVPSSTPAYDKLLVEPGDIPTLLRGTSFLASYGYISIEKGNAAPDELDTDELSTAIRRMQRYADVDQTGILDGDTVRMMETSRCGVHDEPEETQHTRVEGTVEEEEETVDGQHRSRRYAVAGLQLKWQKNVLKYKFLNYPDNGTSTITHAQLRQDATRAFGVWSDVTPLSFTEANDNEDADIRVSFGSFYHTDIPNDPLFDGKGGTLAHGFFPNSGWGDVDGDVHLDDSEIFTYQKFSGGTDFFYTFAHELGHALGMAHATSRGSLMFSYDKGYIPDFALATDDILGIQLLYGKNPNPVPPKRQPRQHEICSLGVDSLTMIKKVLYVFSDDRHWKLSANKEIIGPADGVTSRDYFWNLKLGITGVYTRWDKKTVFCKGGNYWIFDGTSKETKKPLKLADIGLPKAPSAVMHDAIPRQTYFFKWSKVWQYDEKLQQLVDGFPKFTHQVFSGLPSKSKVTAAFSDKAGDHHLLVGRQLYRFSSGQLKTDYPKDFLVEYFDCKPPK